MKIRFAAVRLSLEQPEISNHLRPPGWTHYPNAPVPVVISITLAEPSFAN